MREVLGAAADWHVDIGVIPVLRNCLNCPHRPEADIDAVAWDGPDFENMRLENSISKRP